MHGNRVMNALVDRRIVFYLFADFINQIKIVGVHIGVLPGGNLNFQAYTVVGEEVSNLSKRI